MKTFTKKCCCQNRNKSYVEQTGMRLERKYAFINTDINFFIHFDNNLFVAQWFVNVLKHVRNSEVVYKKKMAEFV